MCTVSLLAYFHIAIDLVNIFILRNTCVDVDLAKRIDQVFKKNSQQCFTKLFHYPSFKIKIVIDYKIHISR